MKPDVTSRDVERRAEGVSSFYSLVADRVERDPGVRDSAVATLARWEKEGIIPMPRVLQWRRILEHAQSSADGMTQLLHLFREDSEDARRLRDYAPFAGILSRDERRKAFLACAYDH